MQTMNYGQSEINTVLSKVRTYNWEIGYYDTHVLTGDIKYSVKLSNGRIYLDVEELQDRNFLTEACLKDIASRFQKQP